MHNSFFQFQCFTCGILVSSFDVVHLKKCHNKILKRIWRLKQNCCYLLISMFVFIILLHVIILLINIVGGGSHGWGWGWRGIITGTIILIITTIGIVIAHIILNKLLISYLYVCVNDFLFQFNINKIWWLKPFWLPICIQF